MFGCVAGILGAALVAKLVFRARRWRGGGCGGGGCGGAGCGGGWARRGWRSGYDADAWGGHGRFGEDRGPFERDGEPPVMLRAVFERLRTTPGQERAIVEALRELKGASRKAAEQGRKAAHAVGEAMKGEELSADAMGSAYAHLDDAAEALRSASFDALTKIHEVLDATQRRILADFLKRARGLEDLADGV